MKNIELRNVELVAIENAREGICISNARLADNPLIYINKGFSNMTGYSFEEAVGKNCRFLQGPETDQEGVKKLGMAVKNQQSVHLEIINYKKDGTLFWNKLSITPLFNEDNELTHFLGIQEDVTIQKKTEGLDLEIANQVLINETTLIAEKKLRKEIGEELHDNINQLLATIKLYLNMAVHQEDMRIPMLKKSEVILATTMEEIRKLSRSLVNHTMKGTLKDAIKELVRSVGTGAPFTIELVFDEGLENALTQRRKLMFYRIIQEQLNNIVKHAAPTAVTIKVMQKGESILLSVKDDGTGFDPILWTEGIGLKNMKNRAELENGCMSVTSEKGNGCEIRVILPCELATDYHKVGASMNKAIDTI